jgi:uncharacterized protein (DUF1800 family)
LNRLNTLFTPTKFVMSVLLTAQTFLLSGVVAQQISAGSQSRHDISSASPLVASQPVSKNQKLLMVLDRFTYGARQGDLERLRSMGSKEWFEQQLDPKSIDDSALEARLANYPAMQMPLEKLMEMYPTNQMVRQTMNGNLAAPSGQAEQAIYADQEERYTQKRDKKANDDKTTNADNATAPLPVPLAAILAMDPDKRFNELCHLNLAQLRELRKEMFPEQRGSLLAGFTPAQVEAVVAFAGPTRLIAAEDIQVRLLRDIYSERQLQELMIDFWLNHFNVYMKKSQEAPYYITAYEREAIRPYALGRFEDLLIATASSPAMLNYLDNSSSIGPDSDFARKAKSKVGQQKPKDVGLNENYGRELMELQTVGVNGGYTQKDVTEVAKVFTGWTVGKGFKADTPQAVAEYDPSKHEPGDKIVMGHKIKWQGEPEGIQVLKQLAESPQCARFISTKLAVRFVSDTPPPAMIDRMTKTFLSSRGDIRQVIATMVNSPEFFSSLTYRSKLKTPQDFVLSAVRAAGSQVDNVAGLETAISDLGMPVYGMQTPQGYSMKAEGWNSTTQLVQRMNFAMALATDRVAGVHTDASSLLGPNAASMTPEEKANRLEQALVHEPVSARTQRSILAQVAMDGPAQTAELKQVSAIRGRGENTQLRGGDGRLGSAPVPDTQAALAMGLILGSPEFQRR